MDCEKVALVLGGAVAGVGLVALFQRAKKYSPPKIWIESSGPSPNPFAGNRSTAGARTEVELPVGKHVPWKAACADLYP